MLKKIVSILCLITVLGLLFGCSLDGLIVPPGNVVTEDNGKNAVYLSAKDTGFEGSYTEWLESINSGEILLQVSNGYLQWSTDDTVWANLVSVEDVSNALDKTPEYRVFDGFLEWKYANDEETAWEKMYKVNVVESTQLIIVTFDYGDGVMQREMIDALSIITEPEAPKKDGLKFLGWFYDEKQWDFDMQVASKDITLKVKWESVGEPSLCYVVLESEPGVIFADYEVEVGSAIELPTNPVKEGYRFLGWYHQDMLVSSPFTVTEDLTLCAKWENASVAIVTYSSWNLRMNDHNNLSWRMIEEFNQAHENIRIEVVEQDFYVEGRTDIYMSNNVGDAVLRGDAQDITNLVTNDSEWAKINPAVRESVTYLERVFAIPAAQYYAGFFANYDLINKYASGYDAREVFAPGAYTTEQFIEIVKSIYELRDDGRSVIGVNSTGEMVNWMPAALDKTDTLGHFVWNSQAKNFAYDSPYFVEAIEKIADLGQYSFEKAVKEDWDETLFGTNYVDTAFLNGQVGFMQSATYNTSYQYGTDDICFIAYPDSTVISILDYLCISPNAENLEAAYEVAKYMTFGSEGIYNRFRIIESEKDDSFSIGLPIVQDEAIMNAWFDHVNMKGVAEVYQKVINGEMEVLVEGNKTVLGFQEARFTTSTGIAYANVREGQTLTVGDYLWELCLGNISIDNFRTDFNSTLVTKLNGIIAEKYEELASRLEE